jgi:hypothetical protein
LSAFDDLLAHFRARLSIPWQEDVSAPGRIWLLHYDKNLDRRVRGRLDEFRLAAQAEGKGWRQVDLAPLFGAWLAEQPFFERLATRPSQLESVLPDFEAHVVRLLKAELAACSKNDLVAVTGVASLFGLLRASVLIAQTASSVQGRMVVAFPGTHSHGVYRLLDARDGWNYLAVPIPSPELA